MKCSLLNRDLQIQNYLSRQMDETAKQEFEKHLFDCDECFREVLINEQARKLITEEGKEIFNTYLSNENAKRIKKSVIFPKNNISWQWLAIPAFAIVLLVAGIIFINHYLNKPLEKKTALNIFIKDRKENIVNNQKTDSVRTHIRQSNKQPYVNNNLKQPNDNGLIAENYSRSPNFENLISQVMRTEIDINVISPVLNSDQKSGEVTFSWKAQITEPLYLKIYNNREKPVYFTKTTDNLIIVKTDFKPGLYYWKLETEENLVYISKFLIK